MKKYLTYAMALVLMLTMSSWSLKNLFGGSSTATEVQETPAAQKAGQNAGKALSTLYTNYKSSGTIDMKDVNTYAQLGLLVANCTGLKENYSDKEYLRLYGQGLIAGGMGLVTENNVSDLTSTLTDLAKTNLQPSEETATTLNNLMTFLSAAKAE